MQTNNQVLLFWDYTLPLEDRVTDLVARLCPDQPLCDNVASFNFHT